MHLLVPGRVYTLKSSSSIELYPYGVTTLRGYIAIPGSPYVEIEDQRGYLWDSNRSYGQDNDCVHSKLMGQDSAHPYLATADGICLPYFRWYLGSTGRVPTVFHSNYNRGWFIQLFSSNANRSYYNMQWNIQCYCLIPRQSTGTPSAYERYDYLRITTRIYADGSPPLVSRSGGIYPDFISEILDAVRSAASKEKYTYRDDRYHGEYIVDALDLFGDRLCRWVGEHQTGGSVRTGSNVLDPFPDGLKIPPFLMDEDELIRHKTNAAILNAGTFKGYWRDLLCQKAYYECLQSVPRANENNISNIIECVSFLKRLIVDKRIEFPKSLSEGWLAYRYSYSTGKSDIEQAISYAKRHLRVASKPFTCYGSSSIEYEGTMIDCHCKVDVRNKELSYLDEIWKNLDMWGLSPRFYVFWDALPYSFIVDWFLPIGDVLSVVDARSIYSEERYDFSNIVYSFSYTRPIDGFLWKTYSRWRSSSPPSLNGFYWFETDPVSSKTVGYRTADATALILGRRR